MWCGLGYVYEDCCKEVGSSANNGAHAIVGAPYRSSATALRTQLGCKLERKDGNSTMQPGCIDVSSQDFPPPYLHNLFQPIQKQYQHHTRLSKNGIIIPRAHMNMMSRSFRYKGAVVCLFQTISKVLTGGTSSVMP